MKKIAVILLLALSGCYKDAKETILTNNTEFNIQLLFEVDGCKVYRFSDGGFARYLTICPNSSVQWTQKTGKSSRPMEIQTK